MNSVTEHPLDDPVRAALLGPHAPLARHHGAAVRYDPDVAPFLAAPRDARGWDDALVLVGAGAHPVVTTQHPVTPGTGWTVERVMPGVQLVAEAATGAVDPAARVLGPGDVEDMLALVARARPGPFARRTVDMGTYLGLRVDGELAAMAGERLRVPGHTEISAVCTHPDHTGRGLATRLVRDLVARIHARGETPFLHALADNHRAVGLYQRLGFRLRTRPDFVVLTAPVTERPDGVTREHRRAAAR